TSASRARARTIATARSWYGIPYKGTATMDNPTPCAPASTSWPATAGVAAAVAGRTVVVAGATGLVGRAILQGLLTADAVAAVHALGRRPPGLQHAKLTAHAVDFTALPPLPPIDEAYLALGTTIQVAGSQPAF